MNYKIIIDELEYDLSIEDLNIEDVKISTLSIGNSFYRTYNPIIDFDFTINSSDINFYNIIYNKYFTGQVRTKYNFIIIDNHRNINLYRVFVKSIEQKTFIKEYTFSCDYYDMTFKSIKEIRSEKIKKLKII